MNKTPSIYVACLAAYNDGILHGAWLDATQDPDVLRDLVGDMLAKSPIPGAEEFAIHDTEYFPEGAIGEYTDLDSVSQVANFLDDHGDGALAALTVANNLAEAKTLCETYCGAYKSSADWAEEFLWDDLPKELNVVVRSHIDWEGVAEEYRCDGVTFVRLDGLVHVFW